MLKHRLLATGAFPASRRGYAALLAWAHRHSELVRAGVEGTGSYGAGLARFLAEQQLGVVEVTRPNRRGRRHLGKTDTLDAEAAAASVLAQTATANPKRRKRHHRGSASSASPERARSRRAASGKPTAT